MYKDPGCEINLYISALQLLDKWHRILNFWDIDLQLQFLFYKQIKKLQILLKLYSITDCTVVWAEELRWLNGIVVCTVFQVVKYYMLHNILDFSLLEDLQ